MIIFLKQNTFFRVLHDIRDNYETTTLKNHIVIRGKYFKYREQVFYLKKIGLFQN